MPSLIALEIFLLPLNMLGVYVGGKLILPGVILAVVIALGCLGRLLSRRYLLIGISDHWPLWFLGFLTVGTLSTLISPYADAAFPRAFMQVVGIGAMLLMCMATRNELHARPARFQQYVRIAAVILGVFGFSAVAQSFVENVLQGPRLDLTFLNHYAGGPVWRDPGHMGVLLRRAASITEEPAALAIILGVAAGPALMRLGVAGRNSKRAIYGVVPQWAAVGIVGGFLVALSLVGYLLLALIAGSLWLAGREIRAATAVSAAFAGAGVLGAVYIGADVIVPELLAKASTVEVIVSPDTQFSEGQQSALVLALNLSVMERNVARNPVFGAGLGAHPVSYEELEPGVGRVPRWMLIQPLNTEDAGSLLMRLLSETGLLGTLLYVGGLLTLIVRARREILRARPSPLSACCIAMTASLTGEMIIFLLRGGLYYALPLWIPAALVSCVPSLLRAD